jgi:sulfatase modifying factor 1
VSWKQANEYCESHGFTLPTREEWKFACLAGGPGPYSKDVDEKNLREYAWYKWPEKRGQEEKAPATPKPVKGKHPNAFQLYDMLGNVCEWSRDVDASGNRIALGGTYNMKDKSCQANSEQPSNGKAAPDTGFRPVKRIED